MTDKLRTVQQAATSFAATLRPGDRAMVVDIKDATRILQPLTPDVSAVDAAITHTIAKGGTALYNGLYLTLKELIKQRRLDDDVRRQAIVVLSDGQDTASLVAFDDVMAQAKEANIAVYTIMLKSAYPPPVSERDARFDSESDFAMKSIAQETGALSFFPADIGELSGVYAAIAHELANEYALGYVSKNAAQDGRYRRLVVRLEDHPDASLRTRSGYVASRVSTAAK
jgi:Ca-activated chloride channel family protein